MKLKLFSFLSGLNENDPCGLSKPLTIEAGPEQGELTSPEYPSNYPNSMDCQWLIESLEEFPLNGVKISFTFFDVEAGYAKAFLMIVREFGNKIKYLM